MARAILFLLILLLAFPARAVEVCSCKPRSLREDMYSAFAIFSGTVTQIRREFNPDRTRVEFAVHASWARVKTKDYAVYSQGTDLVALAREGMTCGYTFERGKTYLVYAWRSTAERGYPWVSRCGHTALLAEAATDIAELGQPLYVFDIPPSPPVERDLSPTPLPQGTPLPMLEPKSDQHDTPDTTVPKDILQQINPETNDAVER